MPSMSNPNKPTIPKADPSTLSGFPLWLYYQQHPQSNVRDLAEDIFYPSQCACWKHFTTPQELRNHILDSHSGFMSEVLESITRAEVGWRNMIRSN